MIIIELLYTAAWSLLHIDHVYIQQGMVRKTLFLNEALCFYVKSVLMKSQVQVPASPIFFAIVPWSLSVGLIAPSL